MPLNFVNKESKKKILVKPVFIEKRFENEFSFWQSQNLDFIQKGE